MYPSNEIIMPHSSNAKSSRPRPIYAMVLPYKHPLDHIRSAGETIPLSQGATKLTHAFVQGCGDGTGATVLTGRRRFRRYRYCWRPVVVMAGTVTDFVPAGPMVAAAGPKAAVAVADPKAAAAAADTSASSGGSSSRGLPCRKTLASGNREYSSRSSDSRMSRRLP
jgi:hypothetical protein